MSDSTIGKRFSSFEIFQKSIPTYGNQDNSCVSSRPCYNNGEAEGGSSSRSSSAREICQTSLGGNSLFSLTSLPSDVEAGDQSNSVISNPLVSILKTNTPDLKGTKSTSMVPSSAMYSSKWTTDPCRCGSTTIVEALLECSFDTRMSGNHDLVSHIESKLSRRLLGREESVSLVYPSVNGNAQCAGGGLKQVKGEMSSEALSGSCSHVKPSEDKSFGDSKDTSEPLLHYIEDASKVIDQSMWRPKHAFFSVPGAHGVKVRQRKSEMSQNSGTDHFLPGLSTKHRVSFEHLDPGNPCDDVTLLKPRHNGNAASPSQTVVKVLLPELQATPYGVSEAPCNKSVQKS